MMLEQILAAISNSWGALAPFVVIDQFERGVVLRLGKYHRTLTPGLHPKAPLIDHVLTVEAVQTTIRIQPQTLTTADGVSVTVSAVVQYEIRDPKLFLLDVWEPRDAVRDIILAEVKRAVSVHIWPELNDEGIEREALHACRRQLKTYGVHVKRFVFADLGRIRTIRLIGGAWES
jgi:membrane protease subunit HflK